MSPEHVLHRVQQQKHCVVSYFCQRNRCKGKHRDTVNPSEQSGATLTCQVLTDCLPIHALTRKVCERRGTARYKAGEEKWKWKSIKLAPAVHSSEGEEEEEEEEIECSSYRTDNVHGVQSERPPAGRGERWWTWSDCVTSSGFLWHETR